MDIVDAVLNGLSKAGYVIIQADMQEGSERTTD